MSKPDIFEEIEFLNSKRKDVMDKCITEDDKIYAEVSLDLMILDKLDQFINEKCFQDEILKAFKMFSDLTRESIQYLLNKD